jgi:PAS domain S-box-containing protein
MVGNNRYDQTLKVFDQITQEPLTTTEVAEIIDCERRTAYNRLQKLVEDNRLKTKKVGSSARVWWSPSAQNSTQSSISTQTTTDDLRNVDEERVSHNQLNSSFVFDKTFQFIALLNADGTLLNVNQAALSFGGISNDDVVGDPFWEAYWWKISKRTQSKLRNAIQRARDGEFVRYEVEVQGKEETITLDFSIKPISNENNQVELLIAEGRDITVLKKQKEELKRLSKLNTVIRDIGQIAVKAHSKEEISEAVCDSLLELSDYNHIVIGDYSIPSKNFDLWLSSSEVKGKNPGSDINIDLQFKHNIIENVVKTGEVRILDNVDSTFEYQSSRTHDYSAESVALIPLTYQKATSGVIAVFTDSGTAFDEEKIDILGELGEIVGYSLYTLERKEILSPAIELQFHSDQIAEPFSNIVESEVSLTLDSTVSTSNQIRTQYWTTCGASAQAIKSAFYQFPAVSDIRLLSKVEDTARFEIEVDERSIATPIANEGGQLQSISISDGRAKLTAEFPEAINTNPLCDSLRERYGDIRLVSQRNVLTPVYLRKIFENNLTDRQQEILKIAYYADYFDQPRHSTGPELADRLGISRQTFHHHLREAQRRIFEHVFE